LDSEELLIIGKGVPGTFVFSDNTFSKEVNDLIGIICSNGEILFVGSVQDAKQLIKKPFQFIDHSDEYILPGFIDSHTHCFASVKHENNLDVSFSSGVKNKQELFYKIQEALKNKKIGDTLVAVGFDETLTADNEYPTRKELDTIAQNNPVQIIHRTGHASILNSLALNKCKINEAFDEPQGTYLSRNIQSGNLDGYIIGLNEYIDKHLLNQYSKDMDELMSEWLKSQLSKGITTLVNANYDAELKDWKFLKKILATHRSLPSLVLMESIYSLNNYRFPSSELDGKIIRGHTKIMLNEFDSFTDEDYTNFATIIDNCRKENRKIAIHATTQNSVNFILDFIENNKDTNIERIEHAPILTKEQIKKIIQYNISVVAQPALLYEANNKYQNTINHESLNNFHPWKQLIELGGKLVFSSDSPVSRLSPLESIAYASIDRPVNMNIEQRVSIDNAIKAWTLAAAQLNHLPKKGIIKKGFIADLIFLNNNPLMLPSKTNVIKTMIAGQVVYSA
jgi:hypothetical protein